MFRLEKVEMGTGIISSSAGFVATISVILALLSPDSIAATNDRAFERCLSVLQQSHNVLAIEPWHPSHLPGNIEKIVQPVLYGDTVIRWTDRENQNGSTTYVVLTRNSALGDLADDPDTFDVIFKQGGKVSIRYYVNANSFAFSATKRDGVNGLLFCTHGEISLVWDWAGGNWRAPIKHSFSSGDNK